MMVRSSSRAGRRPDPIDVHVGRRLRLRRRTLGVSQGALADRLGVTFQQIRKYERGITRMTASRLFLAAVALETSISFFFEGLSDQASKAQAPDPGPAGMEPGDLEIARLFARINDPGAREALRELLRSLAFSQARPGAGIDGSAILAFAPRVRRAGD
jgi:transcriptional regulator with XRE-family HTH domain